MSDDILLLNDKPRPGRLLPYAPYEMIDAGVIKAELSVMTFYKVVRASAL